MAPKRASKPGRTSRYYQSKKGRKSYAKQKRKQKKINSTKAKREYRRKLAIKRRKHGIMGKGGKDICHVKKGRNRTKLCLPKGNGAKGGAKWK